MKKQIFNPLENGDKYIEHYKTKYKNHIYVFQTKNKITYEVLVQKGYKTMFEKEYKIKKISE